MSIQLSVEMPILWHILRQSLAQKIPNSSCSKDDAPECHQYNPDVEETGGQIISNDTDRSPSFWVAAERLCFRGQKAERWIQIPSLLSRPCERRLSDQQLPHQWNECSFPTYGGRKKECGGGEGKCSFALPRLDYVHNSTKRSLHRKFYDAESTEDPELE